jgi:hypothetical protein
LDEPSEDLFPELANTTAALAESHPVRKARVRRHQAASKMLMAMRGSHLFTTSVVFLVLILIFHLPQGKMRFINLLPNYANLGALGAATYDDYVNDFVDQARFTCALLVRFDVLQI